MPRYFLSGTILPERAVLSFSGVSLGSLPQGQQTENLLVSILNNQVSIQIDTQDPDIYSVRNSVKHVVETLTSIIGFLKGYSYDVQITKLFAEDFRTIQVFGIDIPILGQRYLLEDLTEPASLMLHLCFSPEGLYLRRCLTDLSLAMRYAHDTAFYCYRALESLKQHAGALIGSTTDAEQWKALSTAINGDASDTEAIRKLAFPARHGVPHPVSDQGRADLFTRTWNLVERYIDWRLRESASGYQLAAHRSGEGAPE